MKTNMSLGCLAAIVVLAITAAPGLAQTAGFQAGIVQGHFGPTHQDQSTQPRSTFTGVPAVTTWSLPQLQPFLSTPLVPNFQTVIIPNQVILPGTSIIPSPFLSPSPTAFVPTNPVLAPVQSFIAPPVTAFIPVISPPVSPFFRAPGRVVPIGMPREDLIRQFGQPSVTVITSTGETLYFTGNVTVIIQNGVVAGQR
jgi:hypothetical protein